NAERPDLTHRAENFMGFTPIGISGVFATGLIAASRGEGVNIAVFPGDFLTTPCHLLGPPYGPASSPRRCALKGPDGWPSG
ncbi:MAG: hypothetical protein R3C60_15485, partial [Parvularculaceae bacterium]